jgi:hypothetical protein
MRFEFHDNGNTVGSAQWEGPGQVTFDVADPAARARLERYFAQEATYLATPFDEDEDAFQSRRRDWTPWEFERACKSLAHAMGYRVEQTPSQAVEAREGAAS